MTAEETSPQLSPLVRYWRALGISQSVLAVGLGALLFLANVGNMGSTYDPNATTNALFGGLLILTAPLGLLIPFTIAKGLERSEQMAADLAKIAAQK